MAITVFKKTDRIWVDVGEAQFAFSPIDVAEKQKLYSKASSIKDDEQNSLAFAKEIIRLTLKDCKGLFNSDGTEYKLTFDSSGYLSQDNIDDLLNTDIASLLVTMTSSFLAGMPSGEVIINPADGKPIEGVKVLKKT
jgi:hypothetical protein